MLYLYLHIDVNTHLNVISVIINNLIIIIMDKKNDDRDDLKAYRFDYLL